MFDKCNDLFMKSASALFSQVNETNLKELLRKKKLLRI